MSDDLGTVICEIHTREGDRSPLHLISEDMMEHFEQVEAELERLKFDTAPAAAPDIVA